MGKKINAKEDMTKKIMDYIALHQTGELSLDMIAKELNYSKFYMERAFANTTGMTIHKYIQERRLAAAAGQLAKTDRPLIEIAFDAGYGSHQAFTQAFRGRYQCSPQDYRKNPGCRKDPVYQEKRIYKKNLLLREDNRRICRLLAYDNQKGRLVA